MGVFIGGWVRRLGEEVMVLEGWLLKGMRLKLKIFRGGLSRNYIRIQGESSEERKEVVSLRGGIGDVLI